MTDIFIRPEFYGAIIDSLAVEESEAFKINYDMTSKLLLYKKDYKGVIYSFYSMP